MISPSASPDQWNKMIVQGTRSPGVVRLSGNDLKIGWDVQNPTGTSGGYTKRTSEPIKEFDAEFDLSDEADTFGRSDFDDWDPFQRLLRSAVQRGRKPFALDVFHPDLARVEITAVTVGSIGGLVPDGKGGGRIRVHFLEYRPPKPILAVALTKTEGDRRIDEVRADIGKANDEWKAL